MPARVAASSITRGMPSNRWQMRASANQQALNLILAITPRILIAHRLSTVRSVDRIIIMENGRIIDEGDHETLMGRGGQYANLYNIGLTQDGKLTRGQKVLL